MSTLKADTIVASDGSSPVTLTKQSAAKAWSHLDFSAASVHDSFNESSITDIATGQFTVDTTSALINADYPVVTSACNLANSTTNTNRASQGTAITSSQYYLCAMIISSHTATDAQSVSGAVHGDLA